MADEVARLGITIDSTQAATAAANLDKLDASGKRVSNGMAQLFARLDAMTKLMTSMVGQQAAMVTSLDRIASASTRATPAIDRQTNSMRRLNEETRRTSDLQARVNRMTGVTGLNNSGAERAADIAAYGQELDRLRAKYDPLFAAMQRHKKAIDDIAHAQRVGAINAEVAINARLRENATYNEQISKLNSLASAQKQAAQAFVNKQTITPDRASDVQAYGKELDRLRAKYNPLFAAGRQYRDTLSEISQAAKVGAISEKERIDAVTRTKTAFADQVRALRGVAPAAGEAAKNLGTLESKSRLARHEIINLSRQIQDVIVSLGSGQSLGVVALQQGTQIGDVFASSKGTVGGFFQQTKEWLGSFLSAGRLAFGGVTAAVGLGVTALINYENQQQKVAQALTGIGRASGSTVASINDVARASSTAFGMSTKEAVNFATEIASIGLVSKDAIRDATALGHSLSLVLGVEAKDAATALAKTLADPVRNLDALNSRLGAFSAANKAHIEDLVAQNRLSEAQALVIRGIEGATKGASDVTTGWSKAWTALGNAASNAWYALGRGIDNALGLNQPIEERFAAAQNRLKVLQEQRDAEQQYLNSIGGSDLFSNNRLEAVTRQIEDARRKVEDLKRQMEGAARASDDVRRNMESVANRALVSNFLPEIDQRRELLNTRMRAGALAEDPLAQIATGITQSEAEKSLRIVDDLNKNFRTRSEQLTDQLRIANDQSTAFSPIAKAVLARKQMLDSLKNVPMDPVEKEQAGQLAYANALKQATVALSEQSRARLLSARQSVDTQQLEIDMVGKSIAQQVEMRANLQARQQLEQEASQNRTAFNQAEYEQIKKINAELAKRAQLMQIRQLGSDIAFERSQIGLTSSEQSANARLRGIFGDDVNNAQAQFYKQQLLLNDAMREWNDVGQDAFKGFAKDIIAGKSALESLSGALNKIADKLIDMALNNLWGNAMGGGGGFNIMGLLGIGSSNPSTVMVGNYAMPKFAAGTDFAPGGLAIVGERGPEVVNLPRGSQVVPNHALGGAVSIDASDNRVITINGGDQQAVAQIKNELAKDRVERKAQIISVVREASRNRMLQ